MMRSHFRKHPLRTSAIIGGVTAGVVGLVFAGRRLLRRGKNLAEEGIEEFGETSVSGVEASGAEAESGSEEDESYDPERRSGRQRRRGRQPQIPELH